LPNFQMTIDTKLWFAKKGKMKTKRIFPVLVCTLVLLLSLTGVGFGQAETIIYDISVPTDLYVFIPCANGGAGEDVFLSGNLRILSVITIDQNGGYHAQNQFQPQGITGVGSVTGTKYQATGLTRSADNFVNLPYTSTYVNNFRIIGQGSGNNFLVHETFHITLNAFGELTAEVDNYSVECR
jgi:hypothetical protein